MFGLVIFLHVYLYFCRYVSIVNLHGVFKQEKTWATLLANNYLTMKLFNQHFCI